jgi:kexin
LKIYLTRVTRDENPVGDWTIRVSDQGTDGHSGSFIGWSLSLWGESIDPSQTQQFVVPVLDNVFPPLHPDEANAHPAASSSTAAAATSTKQQSKPTAALPTSHGTDAGEADQPAFGGANGTSSAAPSATATGQPSADDEGYIAQLGSLVSSQRWLFGASAVVLLFGLGVGIFFWRRRAAARRRAQYAAVAGGDEVPMGGLEEGRAQPRTKELYDAFGEVSDDDDDADEATRLRGSLERARGGVGFHSGFLDDEDAHSPADEKYRDEPSGSSSLGPQADRGQRSGSGSPESWEHASSSR